MWTEYISFTGPAQKIIISEKDNFNTISWNNNHDVNRKAQQQFPEMEG